MSVHVITVSGPPGAGTTTLCHLLRDQLGLPYTYVGKLFREEAQRRGMTLAEFGALCQDDPRADKALDDRQVDQLRKAHEGGEGLLLEGRLAGWHAHREKIPALKVWLGCDTEERHQRLLRRDGGDLATQIQLTRERERSEADRYQRFYGIDLEDMSPYDLVIDSTATPAQALADEVKAALAATEEE